MLQSWGIIGNMTFAQIRRSFNYENKHKPFKECKTYIVPRGAKIMHHHTNWHLKPHNFLHITTRAHSIIAYILGPLWPEVGYLNVAPAFGKARVNRWHTTISCPNVAKA